MKRILFLFIVLQSCVNKSPETPAVAVEKTNEQLMQQAITDYLKHELDNPASYEPVEFHSVRSIYASDTFEYVKQNYPKSAFLEAHTFRATNGFNAVVKQSVVFVADSSFQIIGTI